MTSGQNFTAEVKDDKLIITIDLLGATTPSKSGKTNVIASSRGNKEVEVPGDEPVFMGLNVYRYKYPKR